MLADMVLVGDSPLRAGCATFVPSKVVSKIDVSSLEVLDFLFYNY